MTTRSTDLPITAGTVPGRRDGTTASLSQTPPAGDPADAGPPLSATKRTRHRRLRHLGRADRESLYAVLNAVGLQKGDRYE